MACDPAIRLSDVLCILYPDKKHLILQAAIVFYDTRTKPDQMLGEYLVEHGAVTGGELERGLVEQQSELGRIDAAGDDERRAYVLRVLDRASGAVEEARTVLERRKT